MGYTQGRFIARISRYLDPQIYRAGRKITVAGVIVGRERRPMNEVEEYVYPVITVKELYLWKRMPHYPPYYWWRWGWNQEPGNLYYEEPRDPYNEFWNWE